MNKELLNLVIEDKTIPRCKLDKKNFMPNYMVDKFHEFLVPDSNYYHSNLNSAFVFDLEYSSDELINKSKVFSLRDGVLNILRYFMLNPVANDYNPSLVIDSRLSSLVPDNYREKVMLRTPYSIKKGNNIYEELIILISPTPESLPLDLLELEIQKLKKTILKTTKISLFISPVRLRGEGHVYFDHGHGYKVFEKILKSFTDYDVSIINWNEYLTKDFSRSSFYFLNPISFYFTDSYLFHDLSLRGAMEFCIKEKQTPLNSYQYDLSMNHGFFLHQNFNNYQDHNIDVLKKKVFLSDIIRRPANVSLSTLKFSTQEFKDWAFLVAYELYLK